MGRVPRASLGQALSLVRTFSSFRPSRVYSGTTLGARVMVHAGARLGSDGFGYVFRNGIHDKIPHIGRCIIEDDVEIGANTTVDRGSFDDTVIGAGTKIDNLVQVAHNVRIGRLCLIMAQVGIAGSARLGDGVIVAGQVGVGGHHTIGDGARIGGAGGRFRRRPGVGRRGQGTRPVPIVNRCVRVRRSCASTEIIKKLEKLVERE